MPVNDFLGLKKEGNELYQSMREPKNLHWKSNSVNQTSTKQSELFQHSPNSKKFSITKANQDQHQGMVFYNNQEGYFIYQPPNHSFMLKGQPKDISRSHSQN